MTGGAVRAAVLALILPACASVPPGPDWTRYDVAAAGRVLAAASASGPAQGPVLTVFIEGDGAAHHPRDPTPRHPVSLQIAAAWPQEGPAAWLGRLCQYVRDRDPACTPDDWQSRRYSPRAVEVTNAALDQLKARAGAQRLTLVGWSGGGTVAALVAAQRTDVDALITIAAPLDMLAWTTRMSLSPLPPSDDPSRVNWVAKPARQLHLYGGRDVIVPPDSQTGAAARLGGTVIVWRGEAHTGGWARRAGEIADLIRR